jgi:dTMP kinase
VAGAEDSPGVRLARGILVAFEGIDGSGKTTQARLLANRLETAGVSVVATREPTDGPHGRRLRASAATGRLPKEEELRAFVDDRREHVATLIAPALQAGRIVIVDRYYFSTAAYQGARGFDPDAIIAENEAFAPKPDLLVLLDIPVDEAMRRIGERDDGAEAVNHFEKRATLQKVAAIFRRLDRPDLLRLDGRLPVPELQQRIGAGFAAAARDAWTHGRPPWE